MRLGSLASTNKRERWECWKYQFTFFMLRQGCSTKAVRKGEQSDSSTTNKRKRLRMGIAASFVCPSRRLTCAVGNGTLLDWICVCCRLKGNCHASRFVRWEGHTAAGSHGAGSISEGSGQITPRRSFRRGRLRGRLDQCACRETEQKSASVRRCPLIVRAGWRRIRPLNLFAAESYREQRIHRGQRRRTRPQRHPRGVRGIHRGLRGHLQKRQ